MLENFLEKEATISVNSCITQVFFFTLLAAVEVCILSAMAFDYYAAICDPLYYTEIMKKVVCSGIAGGSWAAGLFNSMLTDFKKIKPALL